MPSSDRDESREPRSRSRDSLVLKHQHSFSESGRASIPMWDSSDPERAPPPLPLNPGTPSGPATRPNTSARIEEAAALITAKARENVPSGYTTNNMVNGSPEKTIVKPHHRRMQTVQNGSVRGLSDSLERRSPEKGLRTPKFSDYEIQSPERSPTRAGSETPTPSGRATPNFLNNKSSTLDENTPPPDRMLTLQSMRTRAESEAPLSNISNSSNNAARPPYTVDGLSSQILGLTSIATNLQREIAALSRRSRDNATDLISLKEATNSRDEDIRRSLKDIVLNLSSKPAQEALESMPNSGLYLDNKAHNSTPGKKSFSLPRIPSPTSFSAMERELTTSPSIVSFDGAANIALLEKVLREMGTKDGQDKILNILEKVKSTSKQSSVDPSLMTKLEEIMSLLKETTTSRALVRSYQSTPYEGHSQHDFRPGQMTRMSHDVSSERADDSLQPPKLVSDEVVKILKGVKQSVSEGGGLTNEVKALVRELRGEVLGMGREIARKLEQAESSHHSTRNDAHGPGREEIGHIVEEGLHDLRQNMDQLVRENRRQSAASCKSAVDTQEVVLAVQKAFSDLRMPDQEQSRDPAVEREQMLVAVREAWEDCKPEIALEHFGLERDEILDTLKEGLRSYQPQQPDVREVGASYDEVLEAVKRGLADFTPPPIDTQASLTREEILVSVRECLETFEFPMPIQPAPSARESELTREEVLDAVREGMNNQNHVSKEIDFNRDDLFDAVKAGLEGAPTPIGGVGERVLDQMHEFLASMKTEFKQYSAANGKDTEQVLDAMKDGFEVLRAEIESYVDRAADVTGKDEIIDTVKDGYRLMQADFEKASGARRGDMNTPELLDAMEKEFEHLRESITRSLSRDTSSDDREGIIDAIREMSDERGSVLSSNTEDIAKLVKEELAHMRSTLAGTLVRAASSLDREEVLEAIREGIEANHRGASKGDGADSMLSNTGELLDAFQDGVDGIRSDMEKLMNRPVDISTSYEILDTLKAGLENVRSDIDRLHSVQQDHVENTTAKGREVVVHDENMISTEIDGLKVMITQLRIKVEALDNAPTTAEPLHQDDFDELRSSLRDVQAAVHQLHEIKTAPTYAASASADGNAATKDDTDAIETLLRNIKAKVEDFSLPDMDDLMKTHDLDSLEDLIRETKAVVEQSETRSKHEHASKEDLGIVELLLKDVVVGVEELQDKARVLSSDESRVTKTDMQLMETLCMDTKTQLDDLTAVDFAALPDKDDVKTVHNAIREFQQKVESENELTAQAFEARKIEHGGLANKIEDVKGILSEIRGELMEKLDGSEDGIVELSKVLGHHHESMSKYASAESISELKELVKQEFENHLEQQKKSNSEVEVRDAALLFKHDETQGALSSEINAKIDERFDELMTKYDDAQLASDSKVHSVEARDEKHLEALTSTKSVVDDLKLLIDTLGSTTTEACDRMSDDSKTVFNQVADANTKLDELHEAAANQHGVTMDEVAKTLAAATRLEGSVLEHQPAVLAAVQEVMAIVSQHYEHSQAHYRHSQSAADEMQSNINAIPSIIPSLLPSLPAPAPPAPLTREVPVVREYDDTQLHDKLNVLLNHASGAKEALSKVESHASSPKESVASMEKLDKIHDQMMATAGEVSAMVSTQTRLMAEHHESCASEAAEAAIAVEKRVAQKEKVEAEVVSLNLEKSGLLEAVQQLKRETGELSGQSKRLTREVAKLETALSIRREEMRDMDLRAERLERKILEGLMEHAKSMNLLSSKPAAVTSNLGRKKRAVERDRAMSLKRVPSLTTSSTSTHTVSKNGSSNQGARAHSPSTVTNLGNAVGMALKKRRPLAGTAANYSTRSSGVGSGVERRILSTSHVTSNNNNHRVRGDSPSTRTSLLAATPSTAATDRALVLAPAPANGASRNSGLVNLKRSHSVKSHPNPYDSIRKASWNPDASTFSPGRGLPSSSPDKENELVLAEEDEAETETATFADESMLYGTGSIVSFDTQSDSYGTGNSIGDADSSAAGVVDGNQISSDADALEDGDDMSEEDDVDDEGDETEKDLGGGKVWQVDGSKQVIALVNPSAALGDATESHGVDDNDLDDDDDLDDLNTTIAGSRSPSPSLRETITEDYAQEEDVSVHRSEDEDDYLSQATPTPTPSSPSDLRNPHPTDPTDPTDPIDPPLQPPRLFAETRGGDIILKDGNHLDIPAAAAAAASHQHPYNSDSGLGSEPPTAGIEMEMEMEKMVGLGGGVGGDYFQR